MLALTRTAAQAPTPHSGTPFTPPVLHELCRLSGHIYLCLVEFLMVETREDGMLGLEKQPDRSY